MNCDSFQQALLDIQGQILKGDFSFGYRLPAETVLAQRYGVSRPTIAKVYNQLQREGLVEKRVGSGTFVTYRNLTGQKIKVGLLFPGPGESEIFEDILQQISRTAPDMNIKCYWEGSMVRDAELRNRQILDICHNYMENGVEGILFSPLERIQEKDDRNCMICEMLSSKNIPLVLIDRDIVPFPGRSHYDLVGIDNYHAGYEVTTHLISQGCRNLFFLYRSHSAPTIDLRILGFRRALTNAGIPLSEKLFIETEPDNPENLDPVVKAEGPAGIVCANDATAAVLLHTLRDMGMHVPSRVRVASFDDIKYARHLQVPLTTYRQPTADIGTAALETLLMRMRNPGMAPLNVLLKGTLIIRESSA